MTPATVTTTLFILFVAATIKSTLGFGESLVAIPLLTMVVGIQTAAPLVSLIAATVTLFILVQDWQQVEARATGRLIGAALVGVPLGVWGLKALPAPWTTTALGLMLIVTGSYYLVRPPLHGLKSPGWAYPFGFVAGLLGGAYNMSSPPVIVYGTVRHWRPEQFRATTQSFFLPVSVMILIGHASAGLWTRTVLGLYLAAWPVMLVAFWAGTMLSRHLPTATFAHLLYGAIVVLGVMLLI